MDDVTKALYQAAAFAALNGAGLPIAVRHNGNGEVVDQVAEVRRIKHIWFGCMLQRGELIAVFGKVHPLFKTRLCMAADGRKANMMDDDLLETE